MTLDCIRTYLRYSDWANEAVLDSAAVLDDAQLDQPFDMSLGSLRRILLHVWGGESVWLARWRGEVETPWIDQSESADVAALRERFATTRRERDAFLAGLSDSDLTRVQPYRDSKGDLFESTLGDMLLQGCIHSTHHRAQVANLLRRLGAEPIDLDYMYWARKPAGS